MRKVTLEGYVIAGLEDLPAIEAELPKHIELTRQEPGCLVFEVSQDVKTPNRFNVYEEFVDRDSFDAHQVRVKASRWGVVSARLEKHYHIMEGV